MMMTQRNLSRCATSQTHCTDIRQLVSTLLKLSADAGRFLVLSLRPSPALAAAVLFLRKQLALKEWVVHYNKGRPHMSLGPGIPRSISLFPVPSQPHRHRMAPGQHVVVRPVMGGWHHAYGLETRAA